MAPLARALEAEGWPTWSLTYPSRKRAIRPLAEYVASALEQAHGPGPYFAVTHSLGGVLLRHLAQRFDWRGAVMLAPPSQGSEVARRMAKRRAFQKVFGPAGLEVGTSQDWPAPPDPSVIVAGTLGASVGNPNSWLLGALGWLPRGPHDGLVSVAEARLPGVELHEVPASHTWIMDHGDTRRIIWERLGAWSED